MIRSSSARSRSWHPQSWATAAASKRRRPRRSRSPPAPPAGNNKPPPGLPGGGLQQLLQKFSLADLESEDLLLILVLYLMYRESGDKELLFILGGMLFL